MKIQITGKEYAGNIRNKVNTVYFKIDGKELETQIVYLNYSTTGKVNAFIEGPKYTKLKEYINEHYDCDFEDFKRYFLAELRKYSNNRNLDPVEFKPL
jgi:hypothetical protein